MTRPTKLLVFSIVWLVGVIGWSLTLSALGAWGVGYNLALLSQEDE